MFRRVRSCRQPACGRWRFRLPRSVNRDLNARTENSAAIGRRATRQGAAGTDGTQVNIAGRIVDIGLAAFDDDVRRRTAYRGSRTTRKSAVRIGRAYADGADLIRD